MIAVDLSYIEVFPFYTQLIYLRAFIMKGCLIWRHISSHLSFAEKIISFVIQSNKESRDKVQISLLKQRPETHFKR